MKKIVCDDKIPFLRGVLEPYAEVVYLPGKDFTPEIVRDADALVIRTRTVCDRHLLEGSKVKVIATATIGYDHIDTRWCEDNGIVWRNAPGCNSRSVEQYIVSALVTLARMHSFSLAGKTLGVVGVGNVGSKVAAAAGTLGMEVLLNDPPRERREGPGAFVSLDEIVSRSDIITLHVPLSRDGEDATWHLFDSERIGRLTGRQILINSSRGPVVDNAALKAALEQKRLLGAALDVWEGEPLVSADLAGLLDISTPHIAGYSADGKANGTTAAVRTVAEVLGLPLTRWSVPVIPAPAQPLSFEVDMDGKTAEEVLFEAILYTYDVGKDSDSLRSDLGAFERLRGNYPVRREFSAFDVRLCGPHAAPSSAHFADEVACRLRALGFKVLPSPVIPGEQSDRGVSRTAIADSLKA